MEYMEILGKLKKLGPISEKRKQKIELENVAYLAGAFLQGEVVKVYICDAEASEVIDKALKKYGKEVN
jgi:hypothetical protein